MDGNLAVVGVTVTADTAAANRAALRAIQDQRFRATIARCFRFHPYYRTVMAARGLTPADFQSLDDLAKLPLTDKAAVMADPAAFRLNLDDDPTATLEERTIGSVIYTAGSSSRPTPMWDTTHDHFARIAQMRRACEIGGLRPDDVVLNLFPLTSVPHQGFLSALWGASGVGATLLNGMTGRPYPEFPIQNTLDQALELAERGRATVLWGIATYVRKVVMRAQELGKDLRHVRLVYAMGEACPTGMRDDLRRRLRELGAGEVSVLSGYGFTEMQGPALECAELAGFHVPAPSQFAFETLDPETLAPLDDDIPGLLVVTHLNRRGTVLLRYVVGDIVSLTHTTCPRCGRTEPRFTTSPYRVGQLVKVKGTLVNPAAIHEALSALQSDGVVEYQIAVVDENPNDPYAGDALLVRLACEPTDGDRLAVAARQRVRQAVEVTPKIDVVAPDAFATHVQQYKFKRFVDERASSG